VAERSVVHQTGDRASAAKAMSTKGGTNSKGALEPKRAVLVRPFPINVIEHAGAR
jgi:hypothetical protein